MLAPPPWQDPTVLGSESRAALRTEPLLVTREWTCATMSCPSLPPLSVDLGRSRGERERGTDTDEGRRFPSLRREEGRVGGGGFQTTGSVRKGHQTPRLPLSKPILHPFGREMCTVTLAMSCDGAPSTYTTVAMSTTSSKRRAKPNELDCMFDEIHSNVECFSQSPWFLEWGAQLARMRTVARRAVKPALTEYLVLLSCSQLRSKGLRHTSLSWNLHKW